MPEGILTGLIGGAFLLLWYVVFDVYTGHPFQTSSALGKFLYRGYFVGGSAGVPPYATLASIAFYVVFFSVIGMVLARLAHMAEKNRYLRMGVWLALVISLVVYINLTLIVAASAGMSIPFSRVVIGSVLASALMAWILLKRHPHLTAGGEPLGAEGNAPPHPRG